VTKYMLIMRPTEESLKKFETLDFDQILGIVGSFNDELIDAGVLVSAEGLDPDNGVVVDFSGDEPLVTDGPYGEVTELFNGYYIIDVPTVEDAVGWVKRMPLTEGGKIEIRRVPSIDEFPQDNKWVQSERAWRERTGQL
jgi:hypothetical protein